MLVPKLVTSLKSYNRELFLGDLTAGVIVGIVVLLEWMVSAWSERATGDPEVNRRIRNRVMNPIEIPLFGAIGVAVNVTTSPRS